MSIISNNTYLTLAQMKGNAQYILDYLIQRDCTKNAICAMLGNMQSESTINPGLWQNRDEGNLRLGFGLVQWTPATKYIQWAEDRGYQKGDITGQLERILYERDHNLQWQKVTTRMTFREFLTSSADVQYLAELFELNYEQHAGAVQPARKTQALYWFNMLDASDNKNEIVQKAINWAIATAEDPSHGYDQGKRWGPDYDCSSFMTKAYRQAGVEIGGGTGVYTGNMLRYFKEAGFEDVISKVNVHTPSGLIPGDVLLSVSGGHTGMYIQGQKIVHASINELGTVTGGETGDQTTKEICVRSYYNKPWDHVLRYAFDAPEPPEPEKGLSIVSFEPA